MNLYKHLIYIYFVFIEIKFVVVVNKDETNCLLTNITDSINYVKSYISSETRVIKDSINSVTNNITNEIKIIKDIINNNETLNLRKEIEKISNKLNENVNSTEKIKELSDSINSVTNNIFNETKIIKDIINNNETLNLRKEIEKISNKFNENENLTKKIKELSDSILNYVSKYTVNDFKIKDQLNKNDLSKLQKEIEKLSNLIIFVNQTNMMKYKFTKNETSKLTKKTEELLEKLFICLLVIAIILIIVLLAEVRFKIITKIIQRWSGTNRVNENCHDLSESSNNPLLDSRKSDSLKYELHNIKGEMNRIESVLLTTNAYALSELNTKIEKFHSDLDIQFQNFVKEANETIAKMKNEFIMHNESESTANPK